MYIILLFNNGFNNLLLQWGKTENQHSVFPIAYKYWYRCASCYPNADSTNTLRWIDAQMVTTSLTQLVRGYQGVEQEWITIGY